MTLFKAVYSVVDEFISERINLLNKLDCTRFLLHYYYTGTQDYCRWLSLTISNIIEEKKKIQRFQNHLRPKRKRKFLNS